MSQGGEEKKIIIDEDWKTQVQAEKEALEREKQHVAQGQPEEASTSAMGPLPEPSLTTLCTTLATQAMVALGQIPNPMTGHAEIQLDYARHYIDTLEMLEKKTEGNRAPDEIAMMSHLLHELRLSYVEAQKAVANAAAQPVPEKESLG